MTQIKEDLHQDLADFDSYAEGYSGGMEIPAKQLIGGSFHNFIRLKIRWLLRDLARNPINSADSMTAMRVLDFGCGTGETLRFLRREGFEGSLEGCDVSHRMLEEAAARWDCGPRPDLHLSGVSDTSFEENSFDLVIACSVFHHIPSSDRGRVISEILRMLKPGGRLVVFEHNPINPLTRWVVKRTPIDRDVVLIKAKAIQAAMEEVGLGPIRTNYLLFFPPRLTWLAPVERLLGWMPLGGQYVILGEKAAL
ncbi:MAG: class I SAM-dependent methyltransferase [Dehalococcoidia bacterium]